MRYWILILALLGSLWAQPVFAAAAYVSHASGSAVGNDTTTASDALSVTTGNTIVVVWTSQEPAGTQTVADTAGNTYGSPVVSSAGNFAQTRIWVVHNATGNAANVVTVTSSGAHRYKYIDQIQVSGADSTDDSDTAENAGSVDYTTPNMTAAEAGIVIYGTSSNNDRTWTMNAGMTAEITDLGTGLSTGYRIIGASGTYTAGAQAASSTNGSVAAVILGESAGGGGNTAGGPTMGVLGR